MHLMPDFGAGREDKIIVRQSARVEGRIIEVILRAHSSRKHAGVIASVVLQFHTFLVASADARA